MSALKRYVPIVNWLPRYRWQWLSKDMVAGLTVWALMVPEALAYAGIAGVPPEYGLYSATIALIFFAIFATSRHVITGPSSTVAAVSGAAIFGLGLAGQEAIQASAAIALLAGLIFIILGALRMGWASNFLASTVLTGFIFGLAITIAVGQAHKLLGFSVEADNTWEELWVLISNLAKTNWPTLTIGLIALVLLLFGDKYFPRIPGALVAVTIGILLGTLSNIGQAGVELVGAVPRGLPALSLPAISLKDLPDLVPAALAIVLIGFSETIGAARTYADKYRYNIDPNQELIALGAANSCGLVQGFVVDGSLSRSAANDAAGGRSQMASLIQAGFLILTMVFLAPVFAGLPEAILGAIVIHAVIGLMDVKEMGRLYRLNPPEFLMAFATLLGVLTLGAIEGIGIGVIISLYLLIRAQSNPNMPVLGKKPGRDIYYSTVDHEDAEIYPGLIIVRLDGPLYFATQNAFHNRVKSLVKGAEPPANMVIFDMESVSFIDIDGADTLRKTARELEQAGVELHLARIREPLLDFLKKAGLKESIEHERIHVDVATAFSVWQGRKRHGAA